MLKRIIKFFYLTAIRFEETKDFNGYSTGYSIQIDLVPKGDPLKAEKVFGKIAKDLLETQENSK